MIRRVGKPIDKAQKYTLRPGAYAILPRGPDVLLTVDVDGSPDIQLPGGGIDSGESCLPALHREVFEETGWKISRPRRLGAFRRFVFMPEYNLFAEKLCHVFVAFPTYAAAEPSEPYHEAIWMPISEAVHLLGNEGDRMFMSRYLQTLRPE